MPKVVTAGARPGRLRAGPPDERERDALRSRETESVADASASATTEQRITPSERLGSPDAGAARERGPSQNPMAVSPEPVDPESVRRRNAFQTGSRELARFLRQNGEAFARAQEAAEGDASGFAQAWMEDFDHRAGEVFNRIPSEVRALFGNDFEALRAESFAEADSFERDRRILAIQQGIGGTRDDYVELVGQEPAKLDYAFQKMEEMIRASGLRPDLIEEEVLAARRAIFTSYRQARLAGSNPETLLREMEAGRFEGLLPPEELEALVAETAAEVGRRQRANVIAGQVDADTRLRHERQRLKSGGTGQPHITPDEVRAAFRGKVGEERARQLEFERMHAEAIAKHAILSAEERKRALDAFGGAGDVIGEEAAEDGTRETPTVLRDQDASEGSGTASLEQLTSEQRDRVIGRERAEDFQGERPQDPVLGVAAPANSEAANSTRRAIADIERVLRDDPASHIERHWASVRDLMTAADQAIDLEERAALRQAAVSMSLRLQFEAKGTESGLRVMSRERVENTLAEIGRLPIADQVHRLRDLMYEYGDEVHAPRVLRELLGAGLPKKLGLTAHLWITKRFAEAGYLTRALQRTLDQHTKILGNKMAGELRSQVRLQVEPLVAVLRNNGRVEEIDVRLRAAELVALQLQQEGTEDPAGMAVAAVFPFERVTDHVLLPVGVLPEGLTADDVLFTMEQVQQAISADDVNLARAGLINDRDRPLKPKQMAWLYADHVRGHGFWRNSGNGIQLVDASGRPVMRKDGSFVIVTWDKIRKRTRPQLRSSPVFVPPIRGYGDE